MTFEELINNRNVDGQIYRCDIREFFGDLSFEKVDELQQVLGRINEDK